MTEMVKSQNDSYLGAKSTQLKDNARKTSVTPQNLTDSDLEKRMYEDSSACMHLDNFIVVDQINSLCQSPIIWYLWDVKSTAKCFEHIYEYFNECPYKRQLHRASHDSQYLYT